jgi:hypothetical protein
VVVVVMENHAYSQIIGSSDAPYINSLVRSGALFTQSFAATHPSQPNYLILFSGSTQGVTDDSVPPPGAPYATPNLGAELLQSGHGFTAFSEDLPAVGYLGASSGGYVRRHAPWTDWQGASANAVPASSNRPFSAFPSVYSQLPTVSFVIPNLDHDMHDGSVLAGDQWLRDHLDPYVQWADANQGLLILTFDEDDGSANNHIVTVFVGGAVHHATYDQAIGHLDVLRTIEAMYGLSGAGSGGTAIGPWATPPSPSPANKRCGFGSSASLLLLGILFLRRR